MNHFYIHQIITGLTRIKMLDMILIKRGKNVDKEEKRFRSKSLSADVLMVDAHGPNAICPRSLQEDSPGDLNLQLLD